MDVGKKILKERTKTNRNLCYGTTHFAILATQFFALTIHWEANGRKHKVPMFVLVWGWGRRVLLTFCARGSRAFVRQRNASSLSSFGVKPKLT